MAYAIAVIAIQAMTLIHVIRSGRTQPWLFVVIFLPLIGSAVYLIAEVLPEFMSRAGTQRTLSSAKDRLDPERKLRDLKDAAELAGTPRAYLDVAQELYRLGRYAEAADTYDGLMSGLFADDPELAYSAAAAAFQAAEGGQMTWTRARAAFERLDRAEPSFRAKDRMLLRARLAAAEGNVATADELFQTLTAGHASPEVRVRYAHVLFSQGRLDEARALLDSVAAEAKRSTPHVREMNAYWFGQAETAIKIVAAAQANR